MADDRRPDRGPLSGTRTTSDDPTVEPENSTVDDWFGQQAARDQDLADEVLAEADGDEAEAEAEFARRSHESRPASLPTDERRT